jgi:Tol biopolymer transport system component
VSEAVAKRGRAHLAASVALAALFSSAGCGRKRDPAGEAVSGGGSGSSGSSSALAGGSGSGSDVAVSPITPEATKLPGVLWYVQEKPSHTLVRLAGGVRTEIRTTGGDLYPTPHTLPDGRLVAIVSRGDGGPGSEQLALVAADGTVSRLGDAAISVRSPAVDPAGRWIVAAINTDGHSDLWRLDPATGAAKRLTNDRAGNFEPARLGAADLVFSSSRDGDSEIYRMPAAPAGASGSASAASGSAAKRLTAFHRDDWNPAPSPDGRSIAFLSDREGPPRIFVIAADGTDIHRLTTRKDADRDEASPVWSPDGRFIAYLVRGGGESSLWLRDIAAGTERVLTPLRLRDADPCFSPDGAWVMVSRGRTDRDGDLWAIPATPSGAAIQITTSLGAEAQPRWLR